MKLGRHWTGETLKHHRLLTNAGFILIRVNGSHALYRHPDGRRFTAVTTPRAGTTHWLARKIRKVTGASLIVLALALFSASPGVADSSTTPPTSPSPSTAVMIVFGVDSHGFIVGWGTGFFVTPDGLAMTAAHVANMAPTLYAALSDGTLWTADLVCLGKIIRDHGTFDVSQDVAILRIGRESPNHDLQVRDLRGNPVVVASHTDLPFKVPGFLLPATPRLGETIQVLGYGNVQGHMPARPEIKQGTILALAEVNDTHFYVLSFPVGHRPTGGDSGAPVLDAQDHYIGTYDWDLQSDSTIGSGVANPSTECGGMP